MLGVLGVFAGLGVPELIIILIIVVLLFGATRIPALLRSFGEGVRGFRDAVKEADEEPEADSPDAEKGPHAG
ncbi:MAG TPA: twin-arginine translocase TatA/TatE family subunit [Armatimonadetes bacterium]|nr:twin-arginine translocase TatA/TatE family subunit [Armatimonadota bacterium]